MTGQEIRYGGDEDEGADDLVQRARAPLYRDPFEGLCARARALDPADRAELLRGCPRCGDETEPAGIDPQAGCLQEGLDLDLATAQAQGTVDGRA